MRSFYLLICLLLVTSSCSNGQKGECNNIEVYEYIDINTKIGHQFKLDRLNRVFSYISHEDGLFSKSQASYPYYNGGFNFFDIFHIEEGIGERVHRYTSCESSKVPNRKHLRIINCENIVSSGTSSVVYDDAKGVLYFFLSCKSCEYVSGFKLVGDRGMYAPLGLEIRDDGRACNTRFRTQ